MPERLECEVLQKARYKNTLTFTFAFGQRCFLYIAPAAWNTLPPSPSLQQLTNTDSFKQQLKTVLFEQAFASFRLLTSFYTLFYRVNFFYIYFILFLSRVSILTILI